MHAPASIWLHALIFAKYFVVLLETMEAINGLTIVFVKR